MRHDLTLHDGDLFLRPLTEADVPALLAITTATPEEWAYMGTPPTTPGYFHAAMDAPDQLPFVVELGGEVVGSTRLGALKAANRAAEIGWTFLAPHVHGTGLNRRAKRLLLTYAFGELWEGQGCLRVQLRTDARNLRSQRAIEKIGAVREGVLRRQHVMPDGFVRDTVMYSIADTEWPEVRARLKGLPTAAATPAAATPAAAPPH